MHILHIEIVINTVLYSTIRILHKKKVKASTNKSYKEKKIG